MTPSARSHVCQVAFSALNGPALRDWYVNVFGLARSGRILFFPPATSRVQGIPGAWEKCCWLIDQQDYFQLEFFQFLRPRSRLKPVDWKPCDIGYNMLGIAVTDFDLVLRNVCAFSSVERPDVFGERGDRRACVADPEGNLVEIRERDPLLDIDPGAGNILRPEVPAVVRSVRLSVPDLARARKAYGEALGLRLVDGAQLHLPEDEGMWGLQGARAHTLLLRADNFLVELVEYQSPAPRPWPDEYRICDQGLMNIALGYRDRDDYDRAFAHATRHGMAPNGEVAEAGIFRVMYVNDPDGFSVEMLYARKPFWSLSGFNASEPYVENEIEIDAPRALVWDHLVDHAAMGEWSLFSGSVLREGSDAPNGPGCLRELTAPGMRIIEEITDWDEGHHYTYQLRSGAPFRRHRGDIFVFDSDGRTRVRRAIRFDSWIPFSGRVTALLLRLVFRRDLRRLKARLEQSASRL
jgi:catechol 2,3-dioxygenase-like lactoylglutathione lyase family enzyme/uncharacterized protein YndB with AHSA1/START domain